MAILGRQRRRGKGLVTQGRNLWGYGGGSPHNLENMPFRRVKTVVECSSAGQRTGPRAIGELLVLKKQKTSQTKNVCRAASDTPQKKLLKFRLSSHAALHSNGPG